MVFGFAVDDVYAYLLVWEGIYQQEILETYPSIVLLNKYMYLNSLLEMTPINSESYSVTVTK